MRDYLGQTGVEKITIYLKGRERKNSLNIEPINLLCGAGNITKIWSACGQN